SAGHARAITVRARSPDDLSLTHTGAEHHDSQLAAGLLTAGSSTSRSGLLEVVRQQRVEIARWAEVGELIRVDNRPDALDLPASNLECPDRNQPALLIERQRPWAGVDLDKAHRHANALEALQPVQQRACDTAAAAQRPRERGDLSATVACQHD